MSTCYFVITHLITCEGFRTEISVNGTGESVSTALCNGVDGSTCKLALTNIVRSKVNGNFLNSVQSNRLCLTTRKNLSSAKTKVIVESSTVNGNSVHSVISTAKGSSVSLRSQLGEVCNTSADRWKLTKLCRTYVSGSTVLI